MTLNIKQFIPRAAATQVFTEPSEGFDSLDRVGVSNNGWDNAENNMIIRQGDIIQCPERKK